MTEFTFLGTCSGTEPFPNRHHSSFVVKSNDQYYWFDAGENCSHAAYTSGIDVLRVRAVFISHMHIDHMGGLANLIFTIQKVARKTKRRHINNNSYDIFVPNLEILDAIQYIAAEGNRAYAEVGVRAVGREVRDGVVFEDENIRVSALHNGHLRENGENGWHSFSYLLETQGKRIIFSGDVASPTDLDALMEPGCDLLIMETGHHKVTTVCEYAVEKGVKKLLFTHHGREILADAEAAEALAVSYGLDARVLADGEKISL